MSSWPCGNPDDMIIMDDVCTPVVADDPRTIEAYQCQVSSLKAIIEAKEFYLREAKRKQEVYRNKAAMYEAEAHRLQRFVDEDRLNEAVGKLCEWVGLENPNA